jgi:cell division protein FtsB
MSERTPADQVAVQYLLGDLTESEQAELERRLLENEETFEQISIVEEELIDGYLRRDLSGSQREQFEKAYLSTPEHLEKLDFARALKDYLARARIPARGADRQTSVPARRRISLEAALAAAAVVLLAIGSFLGFQYARSGRELDRVAAARAALERKEKDLQKEITSLKARNEELEQQIEAGRTQPATGPAPQRRAETLVASFELSAGPARDTGRARTLVLPKETGEVRLTVPVSASPDGPYRAVLKTVDGKKIWGQGSLRTLSGPSGRSIVARIPASRLSSDDYILTLSYVGPEGQSRDVGDYYFRVKKS